MPSPRDENPQIVAGTYYHPDTPRAVVDVLEGCRVTGTRIRLNYGDTETGRDWLEEYDVAGRVSRSMGPHKIPILVHNARSMGGGGILDHCIVRIVESRGGAELYRHPSYHVPEPATA